MNLTFDWVVFWVSLALFLFFIFWAIRMILRASAQRERDELRAHAVDVAGRMEEVNHQSSVFSRQ